MLISLNLYALSAHRDSQVSYLNYVNKIHQDHLNDSQNSNVGDLAGENRQELAQLDFNQIPEVESLDRLNEIYLYIRNSFFIHDNSLLFDRRISWLYPDDGCYIRAEYSARMLKQAQSFALGKKLFAFGNLRLKSPYSQFGSVMWWYHVALTYRVGQNVYVLDPSADLYKPLELSEWVTLINQDQSQLSFSVCSVNTVSPDDRCEETTERPFEKVYNEELSYLDLEFQRLQLLGLDAKSLLTDVPPWLGHSN